MPRIPYPDVSKLPKSIQERLEGIPLNVVRMGANASPSLFEAQGSLGFAVADPEVLEPRIRETTILRVAHISNSAYELHHHLPLARTAGLSDEEINAIGREDYAALDPTLAAVAQFADEVVKNLSPTDATLAALRKQVSDQVVVNLILTVGCYMSIARLIAATGIELDEGSLERLPTSDDDFET